MMDGIGIGRQPLEGTLVDMEGVAALAETSTVVDDVAVLNADEDDTVGDDTEMLTRVSKEGGRVARGGTVVDPLDDGIGPEKWQSAMYLSPVLADFLRTIFKRRNLLVSIKIW
ncbi:unnamed protein product [Ilex paraguariensis]|uniref:Uncharacterized protein n=1 Tax=Ilex paraguariensis TaxID=185542 RepID=A0ABC8SBG7_9AQUA